MSVRISNSALARHLIALIVAATVATAGGPAQAQAQDRWVADSAEAHITLPTPEPGSRFTAATMSCAGRVWTLSLATTIGAIVAGANGTATLSVPMGDFEAPSRAVPAGVEITVPSGVLEPLMRSSRLRISFAGGGGEIRFSLAGSRQAIGSAMRLCPPREMPQENRVPLAVDSPYLPLARELRKSDIADFVAATASHPVARVGMVEIGEGRRLLFSELCGSTWYYGQSGCSLLGYAAIDGKDDGRPEGWRIVYATEGAYLYLDPAASHHGWPDLRSFSMAADGEELRWIWTGSEYGLPEEPTERSGGG